MKTSILKKLCVPFVLILIFLGITKSFSLDRYEPVELVLTSAKSYSNPYLNAEITATITPPSGSGEAAYTIPGFWDGGSTWRVRWSPRKAGTYNITVNCSDTSDTGLHNKTFQYTAGSNYSAAWAPHGFVKVDPVYTYNFSYDDGKPFFWIGDTIWTVLYEQGWYSVVFTNAMWNELCDRRAEYGFNVFQCVVWNQNERWSDGQRPFDGTTGTNFDIINPVSWQRVDSRVQYAVQKGLLAYLMTSSNGGIFNLMTDTQRARFYRYLVARYAAYNTGFGGGEEVDADVTYTSGYQHMVNTYHSLDPYRRMVCMHPYGWTGTILIPNDVDFTMTQDGYVAFSEAVSRSRPYGKPYVHGEGAYYASASYTMTAVDIRNQAWLACFGGGAGHTYGHMAIAALGSSTHPTYYSTADFTDASAQEMRKLASWYSQIGLEWWKFTRFNDLGSSRYLSGKPGVQYAILAINSGSFSVNLADAQGQLTGRWYDIGNGVYGSPFSLTAGASVTINPPGAWHVLLLNSSPDTTPPGAPGTVRDGTSATADSSFTYSTTQLSANWTAATDAESEISGYQYAIGTNVGGTNTLGWQTLGNVLTVTKTGLTITVGTTYYFSVKAVSAGGTGASTNSNGQYVAALPDTTPPSAPGTVRDGATVGVDISSTTSRTQLSANWTAATDNESALSYQYAIGTAVGGTTITNGWISNGTNLTATRTGLTLTIGTTYYFSVKATSSGGTSAATNSNGQVVLSTAVPDTTAPSAPGTVRDGATAGTDASFTYSTTTLSANWTASTDNESGITNYQFSIGTRPAGTDVASWTALGNVLTVTKTGLSLSVGTTYYFSVKATNGQGLTGNAGSSNGQYVNAINPGDTTPPGNISEVKDGTGASDDAYTYITTELSANWDNSADSESGISRYYFAIGSLPGATDITNWAPTGNGELTNVTQTGLTLTAGTTYYFSVKAENGVGLQSTPANSDGVCIISGELAPEISDVQSINITANSVSISWTTDKQATSQVQYGLTAGYGSQTTEDSNLNTNHSVNIIGLTAGSTYHYRVISKDSNGNQTVSVDHAFTTLSTLNTQHSSSAYPNPCDFSNGKVIKFKVGAAGPETGEVRIYTTSGKLVKKLSGTSGTIDWNGTNEDGQKVTRGIYLYKITEANGNTVTGKLAVKE